MEEGKRHYEEAPYNDATTCNLYRTTSDPILRLRDYRQSGKHQYPTKKLMTPNIPQLERLLMLQRKNPGPYLRYCASRHVSIEEKKSGWGENAPLFILVGHAIHMTIDMTASGWVSVFAQQKDRSKNKKCYTKLLFFL
ncbi:uncharacterized protein EV154DRAFT_484844 [Mucor mucedo]|uniref:uncharacterized protein n=1 Tax=Mucor mucedo TaxID=29922 RepID=UPI00221EB40A|nr:uncharacterized protein EV154DRAFT_484844 [Mucor mucedo]KAI7887642.1 hypothetical protein EV154DRAFT_484844 [Mucor mucedo]